MPVCKAVEPSTPCTSTPDRQSACSCFGPDMTSSYSSDILYHRYAFRNHLCLCSKARLCVSGQAQGRQHQHWQAQGRRLHLQTAAHLTVFASTVTSETLKWYVEDDCREPCRTTVPCNASLHDLSRCVKRVHSL